MMQVLTGFQGMSIFRLEWACMVIYYVQEVGKRFILVGYYFQGAVVAGFLKNFVYACMDRIRPGISVSPPPPLFFFCWCLPFPRQLPVTFLIMVHSFVDVLSLLYV